MSTQDIEQNIFYLGKTSDSFLATVCKFSRALDKNRAYMVQFRLICYLFTTWRQIERQQIHSLKERHLYVYVGGSVWLGHRVRLKENRHFRSFRIVYYRRITPEREQAREVI